jgi:hypothetical protein
MREGEKLSLFLLAYGKHYATIITERGLEHGKEEKEKVPKDA